MTAKTTVSASRRIEASPDTVYAMVSDLTRMGEWSPEATGGQWVGGATGPVAGAKFKGTNAHGDKKWSALAKVTDATTPTRFAFANVVGPVTVSEWCYDIVALDGGAACEVTETWQLHQPTLISLVGKMMTGVTDRTEHTKSMIETTLTRIKATAEEKAK
jgi:hypothetical protein